MNKSPKSDIDKIVWWIPIRSLRDSIRNIYYEYKNKFNRTNEINETNKKLQHLTDTINKIFHYNVTNTLYQFYIFNKHKEELLKQKVKNGEKIRVIFLITYSAKFGMESIYRSMLESKIFEPYILVVNPRDNFFEQNAIYFKEALENYNIFRERGYRTLFAYNMENMKAIDIDNFKPDIIFINNPNIFFFSIFKNMNINLKYLTCYINYSINVVNNDEYHYKNLHLNTCYKLFAETYYCYKKHININNGFNTVLTGYSKLDDYKKDIRKCIIPKKIDNGKKIVIYAPHWSIRVDNNLATFHLYHKYFLNLLKENPNINFVFKPHPDLRHRMIESKIMDVEYYENYIKEWDNTKICDSGFGTVWRMPYISRWIHGKTTLNRLEYIKRTADKGYEEIDNGKRYSINCILFKKEFWDNINIGDYDDEHDCLMYCYNNDKKIISALNVPLVHLFFFTQREENKDLIPIIRDYYSKVIDAPYPIAICEDKQLENENRLRHLENVIWQINNRTIKRNIWDFIFSISEDGKYRIITIFGIKITLKK